MKLRSTILVTVVCALAAYFIVPVALLRWKLSTLIFSNQRRDITHDAQRFEVAVAPKTSLVVRRYGLDIAVNNAGIVSAKERRTSADTRTEPQVIS